jgi:hypothetical protein
MDNILESGQVLFRANIVAKQLDTVGSGIPLSKYG